MWRRTRWSGVRALAVRGSCRWRRPRRRRWRIRVWWRRRAIRIGCGRGTRGARWARIRVLRRRRRGRVASAAVEPGCRVRVRRGVRHARSLTSRATGTVARSGPATWLATGQVRERPSASTARTRASRSRAALAQSDAGNDARGLGLPDDRQQHVARRRLQRERQLLPHGPSQPGSAARGGRNLLGRVRTRSSERQLTANIWTHLATTYDGATLRSVCERAAGGEQAANRVARDHRPARSRSVATRSTASTSRAGSTRCGCIGWRCRRRRFRRIWRRRWVGRRIRRCRRRCRGWWRVR